MQVRGQFVASLMAGLCAFPSAIGPLTDRAPLIAADRDFPAAAIDELTFSIPGTTNGDPLAARTAWTSELTNRLDRRVSVDLELPGKPVTIDAVNPEARASLADLASSCDADSLTRSMTACDEVTLPVAGRALPEPAVVVSIPPRPEFILPITSLVATTPIRLRIDPASLVSPRDAIAALLLALLWALRGEPAAAPETAASSTRRPGGANRSPHRTARRATLRPAQS